MREKFVAKRFQAKTLELIEICQDILEDYRREGYQLTVRQLYYQLVAKDLIPNTLQSYAKISNTIADARMAGLLDWNMIVDRTRRTIANSHWDTPKDIIESCIYSYRIDRWQFQPVHIEVACEKQALEGVLQPACSRWDLPFTANRGYSSQSQMYSKGRSFRPIANENRKIKILYWGDHDPSGLDMDRDVVERLQMFARTEDIEFKRMALTMDQIQQYDPPPNPAKVTDSRAKAYMREHGNESWELDALEPRTLVNLLDNEVNRILETDGNMVVWEGSKMLENDMKAELEGLRDSVDATTWYDRIDELKEEGHSGI